MTESLSESRDETAGLRTKTLRLTAPWLAPLLAAFSGLAFLVIDRSPRGGDESQYLRATVELFSLANHPVAFLRGLLSVFRGKPSGMVWLSTPFVALTSLTGSPESALLLATLVAHVATVVLVFFTVRAIHRDAQLPALVASLIVAAAPLQVSLTHHFIVESLQTLSTAWFLFLLVRAPRWNRAFVLAQLLAATALALSAKETQPLFCVWAGATILFEALRSGRPAVARVRSSRLILTLLTGVPLFALTVAWYFVNRSYVRVHVIGSAFSPVTDVYWGKPSTYLEALAFWARSAAEVLFLPWLAILAIAIITIGVARWWRASEWSWPDLVAAIAVLQIVTVLATFALSRMRIERFVVPILPHVAFLVGWALVRIRSKWIAALASVAFLAQAIVVAWVVLQVTPTRARWVSTIDRDDRRVRMLASIVERACANVPSGTERVNTFAVDPSGPVVKGDWLTAEPANYEVMKQAFLRKTTPNCRFLYPGDHLFGAPPEETWRRIIDANVKFVILADPAVIPAGPLPYNQLFRPENLPQFIDKLRNGGMFTLQPSLADAPGLLIFERNDDPDGRG